MRHLLIVLGLGAALAHADSSIVESVAKSNWMSMTIMAAVIAPGSPDIELPEAIYLRQNSGIFRIYRINQDEYGGDYYSRGAVLTPPDFQKLIRALSSFYITASKDETLSDFLAKIPEDIEREESISGFGGTYIVFSYLMSDGQEGDIWEEFSDPTAFEDFLAWMRTIPSG